MHEEESDLKYRVRIKDNIGLKERTRMKRDLAWRENRRENRIEE